MTPPAQVPTHRVDASLMAIPPAHREADLAETGTLMAPAHTRAETVFIVFLRLVAVICLVVGLKYWIALIGFFDYAPWRFDLMPLHWQLAATSLAVIFPVAATGLWLAVSWGPVIWVAGAVIECVMYGAYPLLFGHEPIVIVLHGAVALIYCALRITLHLQHRRRLETVINDSP